MSPAYHRIPRPLKGFQRMKKRPPTFKCTVQCALDHKFIMDRCAMERHAQGEEHRRRVAEEEAVAWAEWNVGAQEWNEQEAPKWADPEQEMARQKTQDEEKWEQSEEEREAEREKREWILKWIEAVHVAAFNK